MTPGSLVMSRYKLIDLPAYDGETGFFETGTVQCSGLYMCIAIIVTQKDDHTRDRVMVIDCKNGRIEGWVTANTLVEVQ